jgi:hypothetical protein
MQRIVGLFGATLLGGLGWWLGEHIGMITALWLSLLGSAVGMIGGRVLVQRYIG